MKRILGGLLVAIMLALAMYLWVQTPMADTFTVTLTWTAPGDDGNQGTAAVYDIRYSSEPIDEGNWDLATEVEGEPAPQPAGSAESFVVTGLQANTTYYFALKAADEVPNWSALSNVVEVTTPDIVPPAQIIDLAGAVQ